MPALVGGQIVLADWRDALPKEPNQRRPAIVVEDDRLFHASYPNALLVPLTEDERLAVAELSLAIDPTSDNGCSKRCFALSYCVTTRSKKRLHPTASHVSDDQLHTIRRQIGLAIGLS